MLPGQPSTFRTPSASERPWWWRLEDASGEPVDVDAYADELLSALARRLGFANAYERVVDALVR